MRNTKRVSLPADIGARGCDNHSIAKLVEAEIRHLLRQMAGIRHPEDWYTGPKQRRLSFAHSHVK
jgi:hypothetical protein